MATHLSSTTAAAPRGWHYQAVKSLGGGKCLVLDRTLEAVLLFDAREGHKMFWHHQTESVSRLALALCRLFARVGGRATGREQRRRGDDGTVCERSGR